jgi:hypothetical protein
VFSHFNPLFVFTIKLLLLFHCIVGYDKYKESDDQWEAFSTTLLPITSIFGIKEHSMGHKLNEIIVSLAEKQAETLLFGRIKGQNSPNLKKLSGIPYLSGDDTWIDFPRLFSLPLLQPDKVHFRENYHPDWVHVLPLLREMESVFTVLANNISVILKEAETKYIIQKFKRKKRKFENSVKRKSVISESVNSQNSELVRKIEIDKNGNLVVEKPLSSNLHGFRQEENEEINDTKMTSTSTSSSTSIPTSQSLILIEDDMENLMINDAGLDILRELDDCIGLLVLRVTHVRLLYESRDKPQPTSNEKTRLQKEARSILRLAREVSVDIVCLIVSVSVVIIIIIIIIIITSITIDDFTIFHYTT